MKRIDLNCDMGESYGSWKMGDDAGIMPLVTSANIAGGYHAGDPRTIRETVALAAAHGVAIGAHPGLPDLGGFGRRPMKVRAAEVFDMVLYQSAAVAAFARVAGAPLHHVKPHGALYNMAAADAALADAIARAVKDLGGDVLLYGLAGSRMIDAAREHGVRVAAEVFADRTYQPDGSLTPRTERNAMITEEGDAVAQVLSMVEQGRVRAVTGAEVPVDAGTLCLHGDQPGAVAFARALRKAFDERGIEVCAPD
jgi:UPF0271 protein